MTLSNVSNTSLSPKLVLRYNTTKSFPLKCVLMIDSFLSCNTSCLVFLGVLYVDHLPVGHQWCSKGAENLRSQGHLRGSHQGGGRRRLAFPT